MRNAFLFFFVVFFSFQNNVLAQTSNTIASSFVLKDILISGNKRTKENILRRELDIHKGDTLFLNDSSDVFLRNKNKLLNTSLFNEVNFILIPNTDTERTLIIEVVERWYIFVFPKLDLGDRNFNEWIDRGAKLDRIIYGVEIKYENFTGRNDPLKMVIEGGFAHKYELFYDRPYINKKQTLGLGLIFHYSTNNSLAYETFENKLNYQDANHHLRRRFRYGFALTNRKKFYGSHEIKLQHYINFIDDTITQLNPNYFSNGASEQRYFEVSYNFKWDRRDRNNYPKTGYLISLETIKKGLGIHQDVNIFQTRLTGSKYFDLGHQFYFSTNLIYYLSTPQYQPYSIIEGLGYGQTFTRGNELYVINGTQYFLNRNEFKKRVLHFNVDASNLINLPQFHKIPYEIFLKTYFDHGYTIDNSFNPGNALLANKYTYGYGLGLDLVTYYDIVIRCEYSFNNLNEQGFFFHLGSSI